VAHPFAVFAKGGEKGSAAIAKNLALPAASCPPFAKNAKSGAPTFLVGVRIERLGHPPLRREDFRVANALYQAGLPSLKRRVRVSSPLMTSRARMRSALSCLTLEPVI
jgi:hypothetical protein